MVIDVISEGNNEVITTSQSGNVGSIPSSRHQNTSNHCIYSFSAWR